MFTVDVKQQQQQQQIRKYQNKNHKTSKTRISLLVPVILSAKLWKENQVKNST